MTSTALRLNMPQWQGGNEPAYRFEAELLSQARAARGAIDRYSPERIVALGGDCLIDLAPIAYLNEHYGGKLGVLWVDSHPDILRPEHLSHAHAHVLGMLMGEGDPDFVGEVKVPVDPAL